MEEGGGYAKDTERRERERSGWWDRARYIYNSDWGAAGGAFLYLIRFGLGLEQF